MLATGYIYNLVNDNLNFKQFVCNCARAFGPLVHMKDDNSYEIKEAKINSYYTDFLKESTEMLAKLKKMTKKEKIAFGQKKIDWFLEFYKKEMEKEKAELLKINEMKKMVKDWIPPSDDYKALKDFMLQQLENVVFHSDYGKDIEKVSKKTPIDYYNEEIKECESNIERAKKEIIKETKNVNFQNKWIKTLLSSI